MTYWGISIEIVQSEAHKEQRMKMNEERLQGLWDTIKRNYESIAGIHKKRGRKG